MKALERTELIPSAEYERVREAFRKRIIELKGRRRIAVGDTITLVFENRDTIQFQVQEMIRVEHIVEPGRIQDELDVYNALLPGNGELSATLLIEITEAGRIQQDLDRLQGIDGERTLLLKAGAHTTYGHFESGRSKEDKISAVHFVRFRPSPEFIAALRQRGTEVSAAIDHPAYRATVPVPDPMIEEWLADLGQRTTVG
jgi:hypothetical protein